MNTTRIQRQKNLRVTLYKACLNILNVSVTRIQKQGSGCNIPGYGAAYKYGGKLDAIAILLGADSIRSYMFETIDSENMRKIVQAISRKYRVRIDTSESYSNFVKFLQSLQDAHDEAFDEYTADPDEDGMKVFTLKAGDIHNELSLRIKAEESKN